LKSSGAEVLPTSERQARPLISVPAEDRPKVWREAVATAPGGKVTGQHVETTAARVLGKHPTLNAQRSTSNAPMDAGTRPDQVKAATVKAIASVRELLDEIGTPDSTVASDLYESLFSLEAFQTHLERIEKSNPARK
jgi:hypothetical protein